MAKSKQRKEHKKKVAIRNEAIRREQEVFRKNSERILSMIREQQAKENNDISLPIINGNDNILLEGPSI